MAGSGYFGFLAGPVVLGAIAEHFGLKISFVVLLAMVGFGTIVSYFIHTRKSSFLATK
jgi:MFS family permease